MPDKSNEVKQAMDKIVSKGNSVKDAAEIMRRIINTGNG